MDLIIQPEEVGTLARPISQHTDREQLVAYITEVEQLQIRPTLGGVLYNKLKRTPEDYEVILSGGIDSFGEVIGGIRTAMAYYVYARIIRDGGTIPTRWGAVEKTDEYATRLEQEQKNTIYRECSNIADAYMKEVVRYAKHKGLLSSSGIGETRRTTYVIGEEKGKRSCAANGEVKYTPEVTQGDGIIVNGKEISVDFNKVASKEYVSIGLQNETTQRTEAVTVLSQQLVETGKTLENLKNKDAALDEMITAVIMQTSYAKDIGLFKTSAQAEDAAITLAGAPGIRFIFYATEEGQIGTIRQVYSSEGYTLQFLDRDGAQYVRIVYYDGYLKSAWRPIDRASIVYKLMYTASNRRLEFHDPIQDEGFGGITLPEATTTQSGLMSATQVQNLDAAVKTSGAQAIAGVKTFNDNISIAGKTTIAKNIDGGELKVLHQGSNKGFIIRTRNTTDALLPLEMLTTDGYQSYTYAFPAKGGTVALTEDVAAAIDVVKVGLQSGINENRTNLQNFLYDTFPQFREDVYNLKEAVKAFNFDKDLGTVDTSGTAENNAIALASQADVLQIRYKTSNGQVGTIRQVYSNNGNTLQFLTLNGTEFVRTVNYNSGTKSAWRPIDRASLVYKLMYTASSRRLEFHDPIQDTGFGGITLPEATSEASGLMTATQAGNLDRLQQFLTKLETALGTTDLDTIVSHLAQ